MDPLLDFFQRGRDGLQGGELRRERLRSKPAVAIVVTRYPGLRRGDRIHVPVQVEERPFDVPKCHALSSR